MITYPVDVQNSRWCFYSLAAGEIVNRNVTWPNASGDPIVNLDPDLVPLLVVEPPAPVYDSRLYSLSRSETIDVPNNTLTYSYTVSPLPIPQRIRNAKDKELEELSTQFPELFRQQVFDILMVGSLLEYGTNVNAWPTPLRPLRQQYINRALKVWQNRQRLQAIEDDINNSVDPDLDTGWAPP